MNDFIPLMNFLNYKNKKNLGLKLLETLIEDANKEKSFLEKIDSLDSLDNVLRFIQPLLGDRRDTAQEEESTYEHEQSIVSKLVYIIRTNNPEIIYQILNDLKNIFSHGGIKRRRYILPPLANKIIQFCHEISLCYENKLGLIPAKKKNHKYIKNIIESLNITKIENDNIFVKLLKNAHKLLIETIDLISQEQPEMAFKLFLFSASQVNFQLIAKKKNWKNHV